MVTGRGIKAAEAFVELSLLDKTDQGLRNAQQRLRSFGTSIARIGFAIGGVGAAIAAPLQLTVQAASDAEEAFNRFGALFGELTDEAEAFSDAFGVSINRSSRSVQRSLALFQGFFGALELSKEEAFALSKAISSISFDFASSANLSDVEAATKLLSALAGETEVARRSGLGNISAEGLERELGKAVSKATELEKLFARVAIISRTLGEQGVIGDAVRTIDTYANQMRGLQDASGDAAAAIGNALLPAAADFTRRLTIGVRAIATFAEANQEIVQAVSIGATSLTLAGGALLSVGVSALVAGAAIGGFRKILSQAVAPVQLLSGALIGLGATAVAAGKSLVVGLGSAVLSSIGAVRSAVVAVFATIASTVTAVSASIFASISGATAGSSASILATLIPALATVTAAFLSATGATLTWIATLEATPVAVTVAAGSIGALLTALGALPVAVIVAVGSFLALASVVDAVGQTITNFRNNIRKVLADVAQSFGNLLRVGLTTIRGLAIALSSGQLERAALIAAKGIQAAFFEGLRGILQVATDVFGTRFISLVATAANLTVQLGKVILNVFTTAGRFVNIFLGGLIDVVLWIGRLIGVTVDAGSALATLERRAAETRAELGRLAGGEVGDIGGFLREAAGEGANLARSLTDQFSGFDIGLNLPNLSNVQADVEDLLGRVQVPDLELSEDFDALLSSVKEAVSGLGFDSLFGDGLKEQLKQLETTAPGLTDINATLASLQSQLKAAGQSAAAAASSVIGGFSLAGLLQQAGGERNTTEEKIATATEQTAENTKEIANELSRNQGLVFGA